MTWQDELDDEEWIDDESSEGDVSDGDLLACPSCGRVIHEDTQQCPYCGDWITPVDPRGAWKRRVWIVVAILLVLVLSGALLL
jgi:uncharacterized OB-fold protein